MTITINARLLSVHRRGNGLTALIRSDYSSRVEERHIYQVVVEHGTLPLDDIYFALKPNSLSGGEVDYRSLIEGRPQTVTRNPDGRFRLYRIGDAVSSRNVHAASYDALRLAKDF